MNRRKSTVLGVSMACNCTSVGNFVILWTRAAFFTFGIIGTPSVFATELFTTNPADWPRNVPEGLCGAEMCVAGSHYYTIQSGPAIGRFFDDGNEACTIATEIPGSTWGVHTQFGQGCFWPAYVDGSGDAQPAGYGQNLVLKSRRGTCHGLDPAPLIGVAVPPIEDNQRCVVCRPGKVKPRSTSEYCVFPAEHDHDKPGSCPVGNPIYPLTGVKRQSELLGRWLAGTATLLHYDTRRKLRSTSGIDLSFVPPPSFGDLWGSTLHKKLVIQSNNGVINVVHVPRGTGEWVSFKRVSGTNYSPDADVVDRLLAVNDGWRFLDVASQAQEQYSSEGNLAAVTYADGRSLSYTYSDSATPVSVDPTSNLLIQVMDQDGRAVRFEYEQPDGVAIPRVIRVIDPDSGVVRSTYDAFGNLTSLTWPDEHIRRFLYDQSGLPWALTGIVDENNERHSTYTYAADGLAQATEYAGGVHRYSVSYSSVPRWVVTETFELSSGLLWRDRTWSLPQGTVVTTPNGSTVSLETSLINGTARITSRSQPAGAGCDASISNTTYDANGNAASKTDFNGAKSCYAYDLARNLETGRIDGLASSDACPAVVASYAVPANSTQRKLTKLWHPDWPLETKRAEPKKVTTLVYNGQPDPASGNATATCAPSTALLPDGKPIAVLCKKIEQATADADGTLGTSINSMPDGVVLLLHLDGQDGGTTFNDSSYLSRAITRGGQAATSAAQVKFGSTSGKFSSASSDTLFLSGTTATQLPSDFTIEAFAFWSTATSSHSSIFASGHELFRSGSTGKLSWWDGSATRITGITTIQPGVWHHVALVRKGSTVTAYLNGQLEGSYSSTAVLGAVGSNSESVGSWRGTSEFMNGFIDELRVTKGVALYTGSFVAPAVSPLSWTLGYQVWTYTYDQRGRMLTARDPLNKLTTYAYYSDTTDQHTMGDLQRVTDAAGRVTQYTRYDKSGRLMQSVDANGTVTDTSYTPRGWVKTVTVTVPGAAAQASLYDYDGVGQLKKATLPDGSALEYTYDAAHRLTAVKDSAGNSVTYTLDNMGNRTGEDLKDPSGTLARNITRVYDALNRAQSATGAAQ